MSSHMIFELIWGGERISGSAKLGEGVNFFKFKGWGDIKVGLTPKFEILEKLYNSNLLYP